MNSLGKRTTVLLGLGVLLAFSNPAWSDDSATPAANAQTTTSANPRRTSLLGILNTVLSDTRTGAPTPENQCRPSQLYSQHDVVGDPKTCIMNRATFGGGSTATGIP
jgi:hypothetical protein